MKKIIILFLVIVLSITIGVLFYRINNLEKRLDEYSSIPIVEKGIQTCEVGLHRELEYFNDRLDDIERQFEMQKSYVNQLSTQIDFDELENQLDKLIQFDITDIFINVESLKIEMGILKDIVDADERVDIIQVRDLCDFKIDAEAKTTRASLVDDITSQEFIISDSCKVYIGSMYHRYQVDLDYITHPLEPLENNGFTLVVINDAVEYILTGQVFESHKIGEG